MVESVVSCLCWRPSRVGVRPQNSYLALPRSVTTHLWVRVHGNPPPVIGHVHPPRLLAELHRDDRRVPGLNLVDRVVQHLVQQVVQALPARRSNIHARTLAYGVKTLQDLNGSRVVVRGGRFGDVGSLARASSRYGVRWRRRPGTSATRRGGERRAERRPSPGVSSMPSKRCRGPRACRRRGLQRASS